MLRSITCFLIDDDLDDHDIFRFALEEVDLPVHLATATGGAEALQQLADGQRFQPDIIFLDLNMNPMDGKETLVKIRQLPHLTDLPIVVYTTSKAEYHRDQLLQLGATHFYSKPTDISELARAIHAFIQGNFN